MIGIWNLVNSVKLSKKASDGSVTFTTESSKCYE